MTSDKKLRASEIRLVDEIFEMEGGYVLDFSNQTFAEFFADEVGVDIYASAYEVGGTSKAKRLRTYLRHANAYEILMALNALWEYRETVRRRRGLAEPRPAVRAEFLRLLQRFGASTAKADDESAHHAETARLNDRVATELHNSLMELHHLEPQRRGYAFESFLKRLFDENGLTGRASFRLIGEQIDGSFEANGETYLLEAKWTNRPIGVNELRAFNAKVEDKAAWSRGLFVSDCGFSEDGLTAYGRGKRVVCMDGLDISEMLRNCIPLSDVLSRKVRRAAETGQPFARVRDLFC